MAVVFPTTFKIQLGDFLIASNILLSSNNYTEVKLLFQFMNMGMISERHFADIVWTL